MVIALSPLRIEQAHAARLKMKIFLFYFVIIIIFCWTSVWKVF